MRQFLNSSSNAASSSNQSWASHETEKAPYRIGGWNANGLGTRLADKSNFDALEAFLNEQNLDVLCITETWLKRSSENKSYQVSEKDAAKPIVDRFRDRLNNPNTSKYSSSGSSSVSSTNTAGYNWRFSCAEKKKAGTCVLISKCLSEPAIRYNMDHMSDSSPDNNIANRTKKHHEEGRVIVLQWPSILILMTYAPNNGITLESLDRRAKWDEQIACFLEFHRSDGRRVIWLGDLNVAPEPHDVTPPFDWWTEQCNKSIGLPDDFGQPGMTPNERKRFSSILQRGGLVDPYRQKNSNAKTVLLSMSPEEVIDGPYWTWRGAPGKDVPEHGRYYKKGMRIDHTLVSTQLLPSVERAVIYGTGRNRKGFFGSDHTPVLLTLSDRAHEKEKGIEEEGKGKRNSVEVEKEKKQEEEGESVFKRPKI